MSRADRSRIEDLLEDQGRSFRSIADEVGCSDWTVRRIARELNGDPRPMKRGGQARYEPTDASAEPFGLGGWLTVALIAGGIALAAWAGARWTPPMDA
jgi:hypothetical protein